MPPKNRDPDIEEDLGFQRNDWRMQRAGWALLALIIAAGLAGVLGPGPLSSAKTRGEGDLTVEYERFVRHGGQTDLTVYIANTNPGPLHLTISRDYLAARNLQQILPSPLRVQPAGSSLRYVFDGPTEPGPVHVRFVFQPDELGLHEARITTGVGPAVSIRQFTYP